MEEPLEVKKRGRDGMIHLKMIDASKKAICHHYFILHLEFKLEFNLELACHFFTLLNA